MLGNMVHDSSELNLTSKSAFSNENDTFTSRSYAALLAKNTVPLSQKKVADNYMTIKKIFSFQMSYGRITNTEKALLEKYDFNIIEFTTMHQMYNELTLLQKWSSSDNQQLKNDADKIFEIRVNELKFLESSYYASISNEIYNGYKALLHYLREISRFSSDNFFSRY